MALRRAHTIDDLYDETKEYDLVLTTDAPLALALNRRLERPHLGHFATTPRILASGHFRPRDDRELFTRLIAKTDLSWKQAGYVVENVLSCWTETGDLEAILTYDQFDTSEFRTALDVIRRSESSHRDLAEFTLPDDRSIAVVGEEQFTALDRSILPEEYEPIDPFTDATAELPEFHLFESASAIVETLLANVDRTNAEEVAVVMDEGSAYPSLVESAFLANDVPFHGGPGFADDPDVRTFLRLCRLAHVDASIRVADVRPILARCGIAPPIEDDQKRLRELSDEEYATIRAFCGGVEDTTLEEAIGTYEGWTGQSLDGLADELDRLGVLEASVSRAALDDVEYYLEAFEVPVEREQEGVLLASATSAGYVDRPVVFYLGLDDGWTRQVLDRPWIDRAETDRLNLAQFERLVQNGVEQYFLVQHSEGGTLITPSLYFNDLLDTEFETFRDLPHVRVGRPFRTTEAGFDVPPPEVETETVETISQSSLNRLVNCPRDYFFSRLVDGPDRDYFRKGNLFHDFAEFYVNHPDAVDEATLDELADVMLRELAPFVEDHQRGLARTEVEVGLRNVVGYLSGNSPEEIAYPEYDRGFGGNFFAEYFDRPIDSTITEQWFEDPDLGAKGKVDLIHSPTRLVDFKSGRRKSPGRVVRDGDPQEASDTPNYQALLYLAHHRRVRPGERLEFTFFHFLENLDDVVAGDADLTDTLATVIYHPVPFDEFVAGEEAFDALCAGVGESNVRRKTLERMGYEEYRRFFEVNAFPPATEKDELVDSAYADQFVEHAIECVGDYKYVRRGCASALKKLLGLRSQRYFADDVDAFEAFLDEQLGRLDEYRTSRFPVGEPNFDRVDNRDLLLTDEGGSHR